MEEKTEKFKKKRRGSAARRYNNYVKAIRKKHLSEVIYYRGKEYPYYNNLHQYSKNKIHCSCPMCQRKTRNKGRRDRKNYARSINYKYSDLKKQLLMDDQIEEYCGVKIHRRTKNW